MSETAHNRPCGKSLFDRNRGKNRRLLRNSKAYCFVASIKAYTIYSIGRLKAMADIS